MQTDKHHRRICSSICSASACTHTSLLTDWVAMRFCILRTATLRLYWIYSTNHYFVKQLEQMIITTFAKWRYSNIGSAACCWWRFSRWMIFEFWQRTVKRVLCNTHGSGSADVTENDNFGFGTWKQAIETLRKWLRRGRVRSLHCTWQWQRRWTKTMCQVIQSHYYCFVFCHRRRCRR